MILKIEDAKTGRPKKNVIEELSEIPLNDPNMFDDKSKSFIQKSYLISYFCMLSVRSVTFSITSCGQSFINTHHTWPRWINHHFDVSATTTTATAGTTRSRCHSFPLSFSSHVRV
jgi:hypothetical protein